MEHLCCDGRLETTKDKEGIHAIYRYNDITNHCVIPWNHLEKLVEEHKKETDILRDYLYSAGMYIDILKVMSRCEIYKETGEKIIKSIYKAVGMENVEEIQAALTDARRFIISMME